MSSNSPAPARYRPVVGVLVLVALASGIAVYYWSRSEPIPPPIVRTPPAPVSASPHLNTRAGVKYVGDRACADCHADLAAAYAAHPMGRSMVAVKEAMPLERLDAKSGNPFRHGAFRFQVTRDGDKIVHKEWCQDDQGTIVARQEAAVEYVVGSGRQARSFLFRQGDFLLQSPIVWYSQKDVWGLSPGYEKNNYHLHRQIDRRCVYCHSHEVHHVEESINRYRDPPFGQLAIGCERCHGPGEAHVARRLENQPVDGVDYTIVNPRHLAAHLREAVCEQCHLQGETIVVRRGRAQTDYRPGLPLHDYVTVLVRPPELTDASKIVTHVEQLHLSACFQKSAGKFGCISCHDPHRLPAPDQKIAFFRERCLSCHGATAPPAKALAVKAPACSAPIVQRQASDLRDNCLACHMPRGASSTGEHLAVTDHRVPRLANAPPKAKVAPGQHDVPLVEFHRRLAGPDASEQDRDLGIGLIDLAHVADGLGQSAIRDYCSQHALPLLDRASARAPDDVAALEARGFALFVQRRPEEALQAFVQALDAASERESTLATATRVAMESDKLDWAEKWGKRLVEKYPNYSVYHHQLALVHAKREAWPLALKSAQAAVSTDPFDAKARALLVSTYLETGNLTKARAEFEILGVVDAEYHAKLRSWFDQRIKNAK